MMPTEDSIAIAATGRVRASGSEYRSSNRGAVSPLRGVGPTGRVSFGRMHRYARKMRNIAAKANQILWNIYAER
jgi:hypothetical protein